MSRNPAGNVMRYHYFLLTFGILLTAGCAAVVNGRGVYLPDVKTRDQVHQVFGMPTDAGEQDGIMFEEFRTHRKLSKAWMGEYYLFADLETLFLGELYWFPRELWRAGRERIIGHTLRFTYDQEGNVDKFTGDGGDFWVPGYPTRSSDISQHALNAEATAKQVTTSGVAR
jgi:hypothetical protein